MSVHNTCQVDLSVLLQVYKKSWNRRWTFCSNTYIAWWIGVDYEHKKVRKQCLDMPDTSDRPGGTAIFGGCVFATLSDGMRAIQSSWITPELKNKKKTYTQQCGSRQLHHTKHLSPIVRPGRLGISVGFY